MKIVYFDIIAGISGDMALGAFISAGLAIDQLKAELEKLHLHGIELQASHVQRNGITAVKLEVITSETQNQHRHLKDIYSIIDGSSLCVRVKTDAKNIFMHIAQAEAKIHNSSIDTIHFHEVGAIDSIIDIVGLAICLEKFNIEQVYSSAVKVGQGGVAQAAHGKLPIPTPATMEILKGYPTILTDISAELTTPTGAAIIKSLSMGMLTSEHIEVQSIGYGAGVKEIPEIPNLLRVMIGKLRRPNTSDEIVIVEANIDDMNPEIYPFVMEQLFLQGAHDVYMVPIIMKKGRPGIILSAMIERVKLDNILQVFFNQTTTLGVRIQPVERRKLVREEREIDTRFGRVKVKVVVVDGKSRFLPEYEECKRIAMEKNIPIIDVFKYLERELS
ncbi:MAG TPA: nickel pincer cofactor biosynthesis protein LarC [Bacteroidota bacterium]|nr:nickel pincer cofactor biosynthesis protein LarC [Bacteroidota bacterium]